MHKASQQIRILLAESQAILREGLRHLLELEPDLEVVGETGDGGELARLVAETRPDVAIVDLRLPDIPGLPIPGDLAGTDRKVRILVLATADDREIVTEAFRLGACGVVLKESAADVLIRGIRGVMEGEYWVVDMATENPGQGLRDFPRMTETEPRPRTFGLTKRELEIVASVVAGYSNKEIAKRFVISEDTVKHHVTNIFDKLGVYNRLELALFAIHNGLVGRRQ
jgi:two-component system, NarL family, nitrate/nitrite response regulator NarL